MRKPRRVTTSFYHFHKCIAFIEHKYQISTSDYDGFWIEFYKWCDDLSIIPFDRMLHLKKFEKLKKRECKCFSKWISDNFGGPMSNKLLYLSMSVMKSGNTPKWVMEIYKLLHKEFGNGPYGFTFI